MKDIYQVIKRPLITEKSNICRDQQNQVTFEVNLKANKLEIKRAVETIFKVKVLDVRTLQVAGKVKRMGRNIGKRPNWKKAMVTLSEGAKIDFFEGV